MLNRIHDALKRKLNYVTHNCNYAENIYMFNQNAKNFYMAIFEALYNKCMFSTFSNSKNIYFLNVRLILIPHKEVSSDSDN